MAPSPATKCGRSLCVVVVVQYTVLESCEDSCPPIEGRGVKEVFKEKPKVYPKE